jgi:hypothetical protein
MTWQPGKVLIGPPWLCPECDVPVSWVKFGEEFGIIHETQIGHYGPFLVYLSENDCQHTKRAVRLGNAIALVEFAGDDTPANVVETVRRIKATIAHIRATVMTDDTDPIAVAVYQLLLGDMTAEQAITTLHDMVSRPPAGTRSVGGDAPASVGSSSPSVGKGGAVLTAAAPPEPPTRQELHAARLREINAMDDDAFAALVEENQARERDHRDEQDQQRRPL